ncbi:hypothetical protein [Blackfly microvirus SF02]|uniref:Uncharacterized protein n=1 Tax=Blackfly microvirus SF02 TaxID=2576452 RepID=A0A4P8PM24_9VIRU|nr:hypothetical protein [Blackfly microvirus SF02]
MLEREETNTILPRSLASPPIREEKLRSPTKSKNKANAPLWAVNDRESRGRKALSTSAALREINEKLSKFKERDFADPSSRKTYVQLRTAQNALEASRQKVEKKAKAFSGPVGHQWPITKYGTAARYSAWTSVAGDPRLYRKSNLVPCIERAVRRMVLFSLGKNKGFKTPKHKSKDSWIPC